MPHPSQIQQFYAGKNVFLTGVTGYLGKVVAQRLLDTVPDIGNVYCLIRPQKGVEPQDRLRQVTKSTVFDNIRLESPHQMRKMIAIAGDMTQSKLGISSADKERLVDDVNVVIHCAATVNFTEALDKATQLNIMGPQRVMNLASQMNKLDAMTHVSTAYTNCDRINVPIEEKVYECPADLNQLVSTMKSATKSQVKEMTPKYIGKRPNTYTFTKAIAESVVAERSNTMPLTILRPSIVGCAWKYPSPGWNDNKQAASGLLIAVGNGQLGALRALPQGICDLIPVDIVANSILAAGWWRANFKHAQMPVINCTSGELNPITWHSLLDRTQQFFKHTPFDKPYSYADFNIHTSEMAYQTSKYLKHYLPAHVRDIISKLIGNKAEAVKTISRVFQTFETLDYFCKNEWLFLSGNMPHMLEHMNESDKLLYNFDVQKIDWIQYVDDFCLGLKYHVCKDSVKESHAHAINFRRKGLVISKPIRTIAA